MGGSITQLFGSELKEDEILRAGAVVRKQCTVTMVAWRV
jgi:hypothetical protein